MNVRNLLAIGLGVVVLNAVAVAQPPKESAEKPPPNFKPKPPAQVPPEKLESVPCAPLIDTIRAPSAPRSAPSAPLCVSTPLITLPVAGPRSPAARASESSRAAKFSVFDEPR